ncbi:proton-conducting transporter transmembrane domain-containing protein [Lebetimonas sp. JS138]|uniref:proton-conducting transporter transmembrane domain-containing protein n=1 Tax=Lebetimonas sp. JS138 TaxID=990072 RepID=UPI000463FE81|nr:proton-conducting transporter membrane subunit [Lebetimonas sp. JS138]
MEFIFLPPIAIFILSFFKINRIAMSLIALSIIFPAIYIFNNHFTNTLFFVDNLNAFVILVSSIVSIGISIGAISLKDRINLSEDEYKKFYRFYGIFWLGVIISILANNMGLFWIGLEFATLSTVYMIKIIPSKEAHNEAWKYLIVGAIAIALILFGIILIYASGKANLGENAMNFYILEAHTKSLKPFLFELGFAIVATGMFIKMGFFPMNLWLADIERHSIYPVGALFSGILESAIILGFFRFSKIAMEVNYSHLIAFTYIYALFTLFIVSFLIYRSKDYIRLFSLSGIEHMTLISIFWVSGGYFAALLHFAAHAFFKPALFLSGSVIEQNGKFRFKGSLNIPVMGKILISALLLGIISLPPSPMFFSEIFGFKSMIDLAKNSEYFGVMIFTIFLILVFLSVIFYKFVNIFQEGVYSYGKKGDVKKSEYLMLIWFIIALSVLILPNTFNYLEGIVK